MMGKIGMTVWIRRSGENRGLSQRVDSGFRRNDGKTGMTGKIGMMGKIRMTGKNWDDGEI